MSIRSHHLILSVLVSLLFAEGLFAENAEHRTQQAKPGKKPVRSDATEVSESRQSVRNESLSSMNRENKLSV